MSKTCCWWLAATDTQPSVQCGKPTAYKMEQQDDGTRRRVYEAFCSEHKAKAEAQALARLEEDDE